MSVKMKFIPVADLEEVYGAEFANEMASKRYDHLEYTISKTPKPTQQAVNLISSSINTNENLNQAEKIKKTLEDVQKAFAAYNISISSGSR